MIRKSVLTAALAMGFVGAGAAGASTLYGTTYTGSNASELYTINQSTGSAALVGNTGRNIGDLTNIGSSLVGIDLGTNQLWTIDQNSAAASNAVAVTGTSGFITSLAWDPVSQLLYGNTTSSFSGSDILYRINAVTGAATAVGGLGIADLYGLGSGQDGSLFATDTAGFLYGVNTGSGAASLIGASGIGFLYDAASRPEDNTLFASPDNYNLITLNTSTGAGSVVGPFGGFPNIAGLAFLGEVPEPSTWAMMIIGFGFVGSAMRSRRRSAIAIA